VTVDGKGYIQGCVIDWPTVRVWLLNTIRDLFPSASLVPLETKVSDQRARVLTAIPVQLVPGNIPEETPKGLSPILLSLFITWGGVLLAAGAVGTLLRGAVTLSERRGAFVSSVTHELRTPLTTFRMYSEMLEQGMVPDEEKRKSYLRTLCTEADRLSHLVENVLAYARLERGSARKNMETLFVHQVLDHLVPRLADHADQGKMTLAVEASEDTKWTKVTMDTAAVEQILFNLVDNARKYAATASDRRIHLTAEKEGEVVTLRVRDHGPGIAAKDAKKLFQPFSKPGIQAANSPPGIGLGLALSRRLARELGRDLTYDPNVTDGACFILSLTTTRPA
jgi:signal transduction histidine kinase